MVPARIIAGLILTVVAWSCSPVRHVPQGAYMLDKVKIDVADTKEVGSAELFNYLRQAPNHKVLGFARLQLATYNLSGSDTTKWWNRWIRRMGQPPVIYDPALTDASARQLRQTMVNRGFLDAVVNVDTTLLPEKKKAIVTYRMVAGEPRRVAHMDYIFEDTTLSAAIEADSLQFPLREGDLLDRDRLDAGRGHIAELLRQQGYYGFGKEHVSFVADTVEGDKNVNLHIVVHKPRLRTPEGFDTLDHHSRYMFRNIYYVTDFSGRRSDSEAAKLPTDTVAYGTNSYFIYGADRYLTPKVLYNKSFLRSGDLYNTRNVETTYESLNRLGILKSIAIEIVDAGSIGDTNLIDAYVLLSRNRKQGVTLEVEGTNSEGDLGFGVGITYQHRNLSQASNTLTAKARMNYESLSGNLNGLINDRYTEFAAEVGLTFPKFMLPLLSSAYKRRIKASSELAMSFNYQERPEYTRVIAGAGWKYKWTSADSRERRTFDLIDINYVYLPKSTLNFINDIAPNNPLLRYSYEDHFIVRMGYTYHFTNKRVPTSSVRGKSSWQPFVYTVRAAAETAGNLLYAISSLDGQRRHDGVYSVFGIAYSQYAKAEVDYSMARYFGPRHSLAFHVGAGVGVPYGNSRVLPFEKRFYAGGANGVRGWGVRTLGPGCYDSRNNVTDFINQCGDIRLDLSLEYRMKLFWVLEGALFADAGNIWTIHNYENQPGGMFHFDTFWRQIAMAYGAGLRLDFEYFLVRLDLGMKAYNPAMDQQRWPIIHPRWHRDATVHFSVGYPF